MQNELVIEISLDDMLYLGFPSLKKLMLQVAPIALTCGLFWDIIWELL